MTSGEAMFFSRQDRRNLSVNNHAMSVTTETATRIQYAGQEGSQSLPSSSRSSVHLFTFWPNGDGENSSGLLNSTQRPGRSSSHHLPSSAPSKPSFRGLASYRSAPLYKNERQLLPELAGESPFIECLLVAQQ